MKINVKYNYKEKKNKSIFTMSLFVFNFQTILDIFPNERPLPIQILEYISHDLTRESRDRVYNLDYNFNVFKTYSSEVFSTFLRQLGNFDYCNWLNALGIFVEEILVRDGKIIER